MHAFMFVFWHIMLYVFGFKVIGICAYNRRIRGCVEYPDDAIVDICVCRQDIVGINKHRIYEDPRITFECDTIAAFHI